MTYRAMHAANDDDAQEARRVLEVARRINLSRLRVIRRHTELILATQGLITAICAAVAYSAWCIAQERGEPMHSFMLFCAALNGTTILLCLRDTWRQVRAAHRERVSVFEQLSEVEWNIRELEERQSK